jgi:ketosteroid isomerase-like protein
MYTEDAYLLPSGGEMVKGRAAIQAFWTKAAEGTAISSSRLLM